MPRLHWLVLVCAIAPTAAIATPRAKGRVVRIERARAETSVPRICMVQTDDSGMCFGPAPITGDRVVVMDETGVVAEVKIVSAGPLAMGATQCTSLWKIQTELVRGSVGSVSMNSLGVVDPLIDAKERKARMFSQDQLPPHPNGSATDRVVAAIDRDGDDRADIVLTQSSCDGTTGLPGRGMCFDEWSRVRGNLTRVSQLNLAACNF
ncbi:MAG: hypothetical protein AB7O24_27610 [Kofleriaceae bacterium]